MHIGHYIWLTAQVLSGVSNESTVREKQSQRRIVSVELSVDYLMIPSPSCCACLVPGDGAALPGWKARSRRDHFMICTVLQYCVPQTERCFV